MTDDEVGAADEVRYALWGGVDEDANRVGVQIADQGSGSPVAGRVAGHRRIRDVLVRLRDHEAPADLKAWLREQVLQRKPPVTEEHLDVTWIQAQPVEFAGGMRGPGDAPHTVAISFDGWEISTAVHEGPDRVCTVTGRILGEFRTPASGRTVTLYVDHVECGRLFTDQWGEFQFPPRAGAKFGIRIQYGEKSTHVSLVDLDHLANGAGPAR